MITQLFTEYKKRFSKNGVFRERLTALKKMRKRYPENEVLNKIIQIFRQKIYGIKGGTFIGEKLTELVENKFLSQNGILEIEGIKFDLTLPSIRSAFTYELVDLLLYDDYFKKTEEYEVFYQTIKECRITEGPYQFQPVVLKPNDVVVDVGANMGMFSLFANYFYNCKCYAFEPVKSTTNLLEKNIALNKSNSQSINTIEIVPYALSDKECKMEINVNQQDAASASFVLPHNKHAKAEKIHCITLDKWVNENRISKIDFIKADIEGAERYMLSGATKVLQEFAPKLAICTYHLPDDPQVLEDIILKANPKYKVVHAWQKLYAYVP
ncbi:MAG: FkbM family methyltransferase [Bacteroidales bacterium]|nr:FkbM family methyltransferase [Bacteroidales bacterium]